MILSATKSPFRCTCLCFLARAPPSLPIFPPSSEFDHFSRESVCVCKGGKGDEHDVPETTVPFLTTTASVYMMPLTVNPMLRPPLRVPMSRDPSSSEIRRNGKRGRRVLCHLPCGLRSRGRAQEPPLRTRVSQTGGWGLGLWVHVEH